jgi:CelD/BcsL family acetyltransferase involved in cellulose biosynthesis
MYICRRPDDGKRSLSFIGNGISDYLDGLFLKGYENLARPALEIIVDSQREWDVCEFVDLQPGSPILQSEIPDGLRQERGTSNLCPVLASLQDVPNRMRHNLDYYRNRAAKAGGFSVELVQQADLQSMLERMLRLLGSRAESRCEGRADLRDVTVQQTLRDSAPQMLRAGLLRMYTLRIDGKAAGEYLGFYDRRTRRALHFANACEDSFAPFSPSTLLIGHAIEQAFEEGALAFDFLRGREPYKYAWGAQDTETEYVRLYKARLGPAE